MSNLAKISETESFIREWRQHYMKMRNSPSVNEEFFRRKMTSIYEEQYRNLHFAELNMQTRLGWLAGDAFDEYKQCIELLRKASIGE